MQPAEAECSTTRWRQPGSWATAPRRSRRVLDQPPRPLAQAVAFEAARMRAERRDLIRAARLG